MPVSHPEVPSAAAWIVLPGHRDVRAAVEVAEYPFWARCTRTLLLAAAWTAATAATFFVTIFDPFLSSIPLTVGAFTVYRSWRGRFRIGSFSGGCPRCGTALRLEPGARIGAPHPLVCYSCHHEAQLVFAR